MLKVAKFFAAIFAAVGIALMLLGSVVFFASKNSAPKILEYPEAVVNGYEHLAAAVQSGNYAAMEQLFYGQPQLGADVPSEDPYTAMIISALQQNMELTYSGKIYLQDADFARDAVLSVPDLSQLTGKISATVSTILKDTAAAAEDPDTVYNSDGSYRSELVEKTLQQALQQVLQQEIPCTQQNVTIRMIRRDGLWWLVPDQTFLKAISGLQG